MAQVELRPNISLTKIGRLGYKTDMVVGTKYGVFVGQRRGDCIRVSVPAQTEHDWRLNTQFLDLPLMDEACLVNFISALAKLRGLFEGEGV